MNVGLGVDIRTVEQQADGGDVELHGTDGDDVASTHRPPSEVRADQCDRTMRIESGDRGGPSGCGWCVRCRFQKLFF